MVIAILTAFIVINLVLKLSFWKIWQTALFGSIIFLFVWLSTDFASEQSQVTLEAMLNNPRILSNITVLLTIETSVCMAFCFTSLRSIFKEKESRWNILTQCIFYYTGVSFEQIAVGVGVISLVFIILGAFGIRKLLPEKDLRLELHFLVSLLITLLGLVSTANGQIIYVPQSEPINFKILGNTFLFFFLLFMAGFVFNKLYWKIKKTK